jgi:plasmid stabilization system protein ParE
MILRLAVEPQAVADLEEIFAYLAKYNIATARRFMEAAAETVNEIRQDPKVGMFWHSRRPELAGMRYIA